MSVFYSASEAMEKLRMTQGQFQNLVRQGKLKRVLPPGRTRGVYAKRDVDELALAYQFFAAQFTPVEVRQATPESLEEEFEIAKERFGSTTTPIANRLVWLNASPDIMLDIYSGDEMMGYIKIAPLKRPAIEDLMQQRKVGADMRPDDFDAYTADHPIALFIFGIGVRKSLSPEESGYYASRLMAHAGVKMAEKGAQGVKIHGLYTTSYTPYGKEICRRMGFRTLALEHEKPGNKVESFELVLDNLQKAPFLFHPYLASYTEWEKRLASIRRKRK